MPCTRAGHGTPNVLQGRIWAFIVTGRSETTSLPAPLSRRVRPVEACFWSSGEEPAKEGRRRGVTDTRFVSRSCVLLRRCSGKEGLWPTCRPLDDSRVRAYRDVRLDSLTVVSQIIWRKSSHIIWRMLWGVRELAELSTEARELALERFRRFHCEVCCPRS
jgi:hypothetical protein